MVIVQQSGHNWFVFADLESYGYLDFNVLIVNVLTVGLQYCRLLSDR